MKPYFANDGVELYLGDCREILPDLGLEADVVVTDPPYGDTALAWDRWPDGWVAVAAAASRQLWCFGSMRMFLTHGGELEAAGLRLAQDIVWEKHNGSGFAADRFKRVHEHALHWYRGAWGELYRDPQREAVASAMNGKVLHRRQQTPHTGEIGEATYTYGDRLVRSVIHARSTHRDALHPTEKPASILRPLVAYSCPPGGLVLDPFAGSGSTLDIARGLGMRAVGIEADERYAEVAATRLSQCDLFALAPDDGDAA